MKEILTVIFLCTLPAYGYCQKQANIWYFGHNIGLDFTNGSPRVLTNGSIYTNEGVASLSDGNGNLLFYTDGVSVWNNQHGQMPNGFGLKGSISSSQSSIIVPKIGDPNRYYLFTVDESGAQGGFSYSIVNMELDGGKGDIETKNIQLQTPVCEKLTAVKHCNGRDIWVIVHAWNSDAYYAYLVTSSGISANPVVSHTGNMLTGGVERTIGCLKASPNGKLLAASHNIVGTELCDFDNISGLISNARLLGTREDFYQSQYGVEFSPTSTFLYLTNTYFDLVDIKAFNILVQYDVTQPSLAQINASKKMIYRKEADLPFFGTLQTGPDGKIYMAEHMVRGISVVNNPDVSGAGCNFEYLPILFGSNPDLRSTYGLPAFIQSYWRPNFTFSGNCAGQSITFNYIASPEFTAIKWDFGDPASGVDNFSNLSSPQHQFSLPGTYTVKLIRYSVCGSDTVEKSIRAAPLEFSLGNDTILCNSSEYLFNTTIPGNNSYMWQNGATSSQFVANQSGLYWLEVTNTETGCTKRDSINLTFASSPDFDLGSNIYKCEGQNVVLTPNILNGQYTWSTGSNTPTITVNQSGLYWVSVALNGCVTKDTVDISFISYPLINLGKDTVLCEGQTLILDGNNPGAQYLWQNSSNNQTFPVQQSGIYSVKVTKDGCSSSDTIIVAYKSRPKFKLGNDQGICENMSILLKANIPNDNDLSYTWQDGISSFSYTATTPGTYTLTVANVCGSTSDTISLTKGVCNLYVPSAFTPNKDGLNDIFKAEYGENITDFQLQVFNKWGEIVFVSRDINKGWDGSYQNITQPIGVYVWIINFKTITKPDQQIMKGYLSLIR